MPGNASQHLWRVRPVGRQADQALVAHSEDDRSEQRRSRAGRGGEGRQRGAGSAEPCRRPWPGDEDSLARRLLGCSRDLSMRRHRQSAAPGRRAALGAKACRGEAVALFKVRGEQNPADVLTKPLGHPVLDGRLLRLRVYREEGRAASAPAASADVDASLAAAAPATLRDVIWDDDRPSWADLRDDA